jgi:NADPH:quinone reductase-like Zn-dependent oxidoreductase
MVTMRDKMKVWEIHAYGLENLRLAERSVPEPGPNQLLVRVSAVSLNYRDKLTIEGIFFPNLAFPFVPASDASGEVVAIGADVNRFAVGDRVMSHFFSKWIDGAAGAEEFASSLGGPLAGVLSEYVLLNEESAVKTPAYLSDAEAATLPIAALTAWFALIENGRLKGGETVLVQGTGGVSLFAAQIAAAMNARVIITSGSDRKLERGSI